jgi:hypothetical protein
VIVYKLSFEELAHLHFSIETNAEKAPVINRITLRVSVRRG